VLLVVLPWTAAKALASYGQTFHARAETTYVVRAGDTLWSIARSRSDTGSDPRPLVTEIERENRIGPEDLVPGRALVVPVRA
jgi:nucleoid-associated protein YgaU